MNKLWTTDHRDWYWNVYLKSDHWRDLRAAKLAANPVCERCKKRRSAEPHHLRYKNIFDVVLTDLLAVCRECHAEIHRIEGRPKRTKITRDYWPKRALEAVRKRLDYEKRKRRDLRRERSRIWTKDERKAFHQRNAKRERWLSTFVRLNK
jgi:hypothetical protein